MSAKICGVGMRTSADSRTRARDPARAFCRTAPRNTLDYETPPVPCRTQNSSNRVRPDTPSMAPDASSHRAKGRPDMYATIPPNTAPPAAYGPGS